MFNLIICSSSLQILPSYLVKASGDGGDGVLFIVEADLYLKSVLLTFKTLPGIENNGETVVFVKDGIGDDACEDDDADDVGDNVWPLGQKTLASALSWGGRVPIGALGGGGGGVGPSNLPSAS